MKNPTKLISMLILTTFTITSKAQVSCTVDSCKDIFIPNTITPNNDRFNDRFEISLTNCNCIIDQIELRIYNRWETCVYREITNNSNATFLWNGEDNDKNTLSAGVYFYFIELNYQVNSEAKVNSWKGWVKIVC